MQSHKRRRAPRTTIAQYALMLEFFSKHTVLLNNRQSFSAVSMKEIDKLWNKLAITLNNSGSGASKSVDQWKRTWVEWKSNTKRRCREDMLDQKNGLKARRLTELEQRLMDLVNSENANNSELATSFKEEKPSTSPFDALEMAIEETNSNIHSTDFGQLKNNISTETESPVLIDSPKDLTGVCTVICNSLNGVALAIRELAQSQNKMAEANIKLADVIIQQMEMTNCFTKKDNINI